MNEAGFVLYLTYDGLTDPLGRSQILPYLVGLSGKGYRITIISFEKKNRFAKVADAVKTICGSAGIHWIPMRYHKSPPVLSTVYDLVRMNRAAFKVVRENGKGIVHCRSYLTSLVGLRIQKKTGFRFLFDMRGFWVDERVEGDLWRLNNPLYKLIYSYFKRKEKEFLRSADHVISLTRRAENEINSWAGRPVALTIIPTCVDLALFNPLKISELEKTQKRMELGLTPNDFVLVYTGSIGTWYLVNEMIGFFSELILIQPASKFLIISNEPYHLPEALKKNIQTFSSSRELVPTYLSIADAAVSFVRPSFSKQATSPTKLGEFIAMNLPVIVNAGVGDTDEVLRSYEKSIIVQNFSKEEMSAAARRLLNAKWGNVPSKIVEYFSLDRAIDSYDAVYKTVINKR